MRIISGRNEEQTPGPSTRGGSLALVFVLALLGGPQIAAAGPFDDPAPSPPSADAVPSATPSHLGSTGDDPGSDIAEDAGDLVSETLSPTPSPTPEATPSPTPEPEDRADPRDDGDDGDPPTEEPSAPSDPRDDTTALDPLPEPPLLELEAPVEPVIPWVPPGRRSTTDLLERFEALDLPEDAARRILAPFPVFGPAHYSDDWHAPRSGGRLHEGVDVFAPRGTPIIAAADGVISQVRAGSSRGGKSVWLTEPDGTYYFYAHLEAFHPDVARGVRVSGGDVLGYVGTTGNAEGTTPHLHFEIHPRGGEAVPPVRYLDRWLDTAREAVGFFVPLRPAQVALPDARFELALAVSPPRPPTLPTELGITRVRAAEANPSGGGPPGPLVVLAVGALGFPLLRRLLGARTRSPKRGGRGA